MKIEKIATQCPVCKGKKVLPDSIAKNLPKYKPGKTYKCTHCSGKGFVFKKIGS